LRDAGTKAKKAGSASGSLTGGAIPSLDWDGFYRAARAIGLSPSEFWEMTLPEFLEEIAICEERAAGQSGRMTAADFDDLRDWMEDSK